MINGNIVSGKWTEFKGEVQKVWGNITADDLEKTKGNIQAVTGLIQERYGVFQEEARHTLNSLLSRFGFESEASSLPEDIARNVQDRPVAGVTNRESAEL